MLIHTIRTLAQIFVIRKITKYTERKHISFIHNFIIEYWNKGIMNVQINRDLARTTMIDDSNTMLSQAPSAITNDTIFQESGLSWDAKKRKLEDIYSNGRYQDEDEYEIVKVRKIVRNHIFKHVKFCKGEGKRSPNNFDKKTKKIQAFGTSHEKADLWKTTGYEYNVMKLAGYCEETKSLADRAMWWKAYNEHMLEETRQLRGRTSSGIKTCVIEGK